MLRSIRSEEVLIHSQALIETGSGANEILLKSPDWQASIRDVVTRLAAKLVVTPNGRTSLIGGESLLHPYQLALTERGVATHLHGEALAAYGLDRMARARKLAN